VALESEAGAVSQSFWSRLHVRLVAGAGLVTVLATAAGSVLGLIPSFMSLMPWVAPPPPPEPIALRAIDYAQGPEIQRAAEHPTARQYGNVIMNRDPPGNRRNWAEWQVNVVAPGRYRGVIEYAIKEPRPVDVFIGRQLVAARALNQSTGCDYAECQLKLDVGAVTLRTGTVTLRIDRPEGPFPHIRQIELLPAQL